MHFWYPSRFASSAIKIKIHELLKRSFYHVLQTHSLFWNEGLLWINIWTKCPLKSSNCVTGIPGQMINTRLEDTVLRVWNPRMETSTRWWLPVHVKMIQDFFLPENIRILIIGHFYTELDCQEFNRPRKLLPIEITRWTFFRRQARSEMNS